MANMTHHDDGPPPPSAEQVDLDADLEFFRRLGWPITLDVRRQRLVVRTGDVLDALITPSPLASAVATALSTCLLTGPVSTNSDHRWSTFLTAPSQQTKLRLPDELKTAKVYAVPRGAHAVLPHPADTEHWPQIPQQDRPLPPWAAVVSTIRKILQTQRTQH